MLKFFVVSAGRDMVTHAGSYHVQVQAQSTIIISKKYKKRRTFRKHGFWWENNLKFSDKKNTSSPDQTIPWNTRPKIQHMNMALVNSKKQTKQNLKKKHSDQTVGSLQD